MTTYLAVARIKLGPSADDHNEWSPKSDYLERGDEVDVSGLDEDHLASLLADEVIMEESNFRARFPEVNEGANQPYGTPSNLDRIEGTKQQVNPPANDPADEAPAVRDPLPNPADPPHVEGATDPGVEASGADDKEDDASSTSSTDED